ncbi:MAG: zf-HC2 domain-containing protein [Acidobacteriaceae bacterium]|nr:zf-HC2 domain-containing protein [Acidobacteriaceae bacterium]
MTAENGRSLHPSAAALALYAGGDLQWTDRWRMRRHIAGCPECEGQVSLFRSAKAELRREAHSETLTGFEAIADWSRLEREMLGNIAVGVAAARCVDKVRRGRALLVRAAVVTGLVVLFAAGWMTHIPREQTEHLTASLRQLMGLERPQPAGAVLRANGEGVAVRAQGATLTMLHPASAVISLSGSSAVSARYVDEETGQVTITKVYAQ